VKILFDREYQKQSQFKFHKKLGEINYKEYLEGSDDEDVNPNAQMESLVEDPLEHLGNKTVT